ncbi:fibronectin type III domain-containing protein [Acidobacteriota bacterium]
MKSLSALQIGSVIQLKWTNPTSYLNGAPLSEATEVEIWFYSAEKESVEAMSSPAAVDFGDHSNLLVSLSRETEDLTEEAVDESGLPEKHEFHLEDEESLNSIYVFAVRIKDGKRFSGFSSPVKFEPEAVSLPPLNLRVEVFKEKIELRWDAPQANIDGSSPPVLEGYNLYRQEEGEEGEDKKKLNSVLLVQNFYEDSKFSYGSIYSYSVRSFFSSETELNESADSIPIQVTAEDIYPPDAPKELIAIPGADQISVSWNSGTEDDLSGYRIWRRMEGESELKLMNFLLLQKNIFEDKAVLQGQRYYYSVTAVDSEGNESDRSEITSAELKES